MSAARWPWATSFSSEPPCEQPQKWVIITVRKDPVQRCRLRTATIPPEPPWEMLTAEEV
jgi:hypothetical protein